MYNEFTKNAAHRQLYPLFLPNDAALNLHVVPKWQPSAKSLYQGYFALLAPCALATIAIYRKCSFMGSASKSSGIIGKRLVASSASHKSAPLLDRFGIIACPHDISY
jgi:hypothetical protein